MAEPCARGRLKIYFGYAAGVGKTYQMLEDARALKARGVDVVIGFLTPRGRPDIVSGAEGSGDDSAGASGVPRRDGGGDGRRRHPAPPAAGLRGR